MYARPKPQETDEDLLRMHEEFQKHKSEDKIKLAATVISERETEKPEFSQDTDIQEQIANTFEAVPRTDIGRIVEKHIGDRNVSELSFNKSRGFPRAKRRDLSFQQSSSSTSIFAQQMKKLKPSLEPMEVDHVTLPSQSFVVTGPEKTEIHVENVAKLKSMSQDEILEEKERLMASMDPALIQFLKSRRKTENSAATNRNLSIQEQNKAAESVDFEKIATPSEILRQENSSQWLNFDLIETNKLAWMQDIEAPKIDRKAAFEARFDFEGWLMPYSENGINEKSRILYHHGEEPGRPGYTLQELFQLSRSNVIQQKIVALNAIANILSLQTTGIYDNIIDLPIEQIFFVLRYCLDDNTPSVLNASIKAMRNLFHSKIDETCVDCLLGFALGEIQPILAIDNEKSDDDRVNDQQLAETNLVKLLTRTEILTRIRYIINTVKPFTETIIYCVDILVRLARDSEFVFLTVYNCDGLIRSIVENFLPKTPKPLNNTESPYGLPLLHCVKFMRILASRSKTVAEELLIKYNVMDSILVYLSSANYSLNVNGLRLQTESMHFWATILHYKLSQDYFELASPVVIELLNYHLKNTNLEIDTTFVRQGHVAAVLRLIGAYGRNFKLIPAYFGILERCFFKWAKQFQKLTECSCGKLQIISTLLYCLTCLTKSNQIQDTFLFQIKEQIFEMINSDAFNIITKTIKNGSMLLNNYETHKSSPNLQTLETAAWHTSEHTIPLIQSNSPLPFLKNLARFIECLDDSKIKLSFIRNQNLSEYLQLLRRQDRYFLTNHWFTRIESGLIMHVLKIAVAVKAEIDDTSLFYELSVKCLSVFNSELKPEMEFLLRDIIFNSRFYPNEVLLKNLDIRQRSDSLKNLGDILSVYTRVLGLQNDVPDFKDNLSLDVKIGNVIPIDWIYTPIIALYSNQQQQHKNNQKLAESEQVFIIRNCLRWILIYETYFPGLAASINATDRFCRIACVFLGSDSLFLVDEIHSLLELCLKNVISKCEAEIDFNREIEGLTSFQDFYIQLLEQYQGVSYGDVLFGNFMLVPLAQRHSVKWRKALWSEYLGVVEIFNVAPDQCVCQLDSFLYPIEEDISLLKCYRRALVNNSVRKHSVLFAIAKHHVEEYVKLKRMKSV